MWFRELLAWPIYCLAFCFHLLCALFTWLADWVSGHAPPKHGEKIIVALFIFGWTGLVGVVASKVDPHPPDVFPVARVDHSNIEHGFSPDAIKNVLPAIRNNGCLEALNAVRTALKPEMAGFEPCTETGPYDISISKNLKEMTVSGVASVGDARRKFTVVMQHYPSAIWAGGMTVNEVRMQ